MPTRVFPVIPLLIAFTPLFSACADNASNGPDFDRPPSPDDAAVCLEGERFVADGSIPLDGAEPGDADAVSGLRWEAHEGCERFVIDLVDADGEPADAVGAVRAEVLRDLGVVRVTLPGVERVDTDATDADFNGALAREAYVMWADEGRWIDVDLHLADEAEADASVLSDPARVVVDLRPGGDPIPEPAATHPRVVLLDPRPGEAAYPLTATGYARTFEANVVARIEQEGNEVDETFTTATSWVDAWGHFSITFEHGPPGAIELHVGEYSAKDGTWEGVSVDLEMR